MMERDILSRIRHSFLANIYYAFQDSENLYLAIEIVPGGDLGYHLRKRKFKEEQAKFIIASIIIALEYLHNNNLIHRNVTPSNILLDKKGYVKLSDFVLSREWEEDNSSDTSGTPGYMAPEIMCRQNYTFSSDYFAIGVIGYQMMLRKMPYTGTTRSEIIDQIKKKQVQLKKHEIPEGWSLESADFINKCIQRKPECRLGLNGPNELRQHVWLRDFDWQGLIEKEIPSHFTPNREKHKYEHFEQNSEQSWYLDSKGNIKHAGDKDAEKQEGSDIEQDNMIGDKQEEEKEQSVRDENDDKISL